MKTTAHTLAQRDAKHIWHPLTQHKIHPKVLGIIRAKGALLYDESGKEYIDGIASWYTAMYGHCNPYITKRVKAQMDELDQIVFTGLTHPPAVELSEALIEILPDNQTKLFFSDNGSTAVEVGIKMALQYHHNRGSRRHKLVAFENGFHGDTFGAMSVSGLSVYNGPFERHFLQVARIPVPYGSNNEEVLEKLNQLIAKGDVAGFVFEPLVQGAAAMQMHDAAGLDAMIALCQKNDVITVADEVMTGFGKTGRNFASDWLENKPDAICMSKALTAGLIPMAITSCSQEIYDAFYSDNRAKGLFHAHTYTANPLACRAALAGIKLLQSREIQEGINRISKMHAEFDSKIKNHSKVISTRQSGVIYAFDLNIEMERYGDLRDQIFQFFMARGVFLRPLGNTVYILPPYVISEEQLECIYGVIEEFLSSELLT